MRRLLLLALLAASLLAPSLTPGTAQAQDPGNRLSLEALTAPQPGDGGGYRRRGGYRSSGYSSGGYHRRRPSYGYGRRSTRQSYRRHYERRQSYHRARRR